MVHLLLLMLLLLLLLWVESGWVLGLVAGGRAWGCLTCERGQWDGLAVLWCEWQVLRMRGVGIVWLAVGVRVWVVLRVLVRGCNSIGIERWGLHPSAYRWEGVSHREDRLRGQTLLHRHGHHYWGGRGLGKLGVHLLQV